MNGTHYNLLPESVDTDADLIFRSVHGPPLLVQISRIVASEDEEATVSESLKKSNFACVVRDPLDEKHVIQAVQGKMEKNYSHPEILVLVLYAYEQVALPRGYRVSSDIKVPFKEVWVVDFRQAHRCAVRIHKRVSRRDHPWK
jgi:hypothetical protein